MNRSSIAPPISGLEYLLSFSDFNASKASKLHHGSSDTTEQAAVRVEEGTTFSWAGSNTTIDSTSGSPSSSEPTTGGDDALPLANPAPSCSNQPPDFALFTDEWALNVDKLDQGIFNWCPTWDITSTTGGGAGMT